MSVFLYLDLCKFTRACVFTKHVKSEVHGGLLEPSHTRQSFTLNCSKTPIINESICKILTETVSERNMFVVFMLFIATQTE